MLCTVLLQIWCQLERKGLESSVAGPEGDPASICISTSRECQCSCVLATISPLDITFTLPNLLTVRARGTYGIAACCQKIEHCKIDCVSEFVPCMLHLLRLPLDEGVVHGNLNP
eukprot:1159569-Pelagomonas_calceolata.AAC.3